MIDKNVCICKIKIIIKYKRNSSFFEKGLSIPEVSLISGHKDVRQLMRYTHLKVETLINKIEL